MSRTGRAAGPTAVPGVGLLLSDLMSRPRACLVASPPTTSSPTTSRNASMPPVAPTSSATDAPRPSSATTAARVRRMPGRVTA